MPLVWDCLYHGPRAALQAQDQDHVVQAILAVLIPVQLKMCLSLHTQMTENPCVKIWSLVVVMMTLPLDGTGKGIGAPPNAGPAVGRRPATTTLRHVAAPAGAEFEWSAPAELKTLAWFSQIGLGCHIRQHPGHQTNWERECLS